ncbi:MAG TPA: RNA polymerase factor sigma-54 [Thermoanaerobaculia bacterium]|jgi:RNA polymerase sigma-54 factor|nr:RNA polymerase factor sigma-54 [Thermoanaerobaculia bacterium]
MALEQKLSLRLAQKLVMTPSLQQAIKLLQLTRMELETVLNQELVENPVLEEREETPEEPEQQAAEDPPAEQKKDEVDHQEAMGDIDLEAYFNDYWESNSYQGQQVLGIPEAPPLENTLTREPDLYDHLLWQLHMSGAPDDLRRLAELIIGNLDTDGFLVASLEEIQEMGSIDDGEPFPREDVERALQLVQSFDPPGVGCHDLRESLLAQLDHQGESHDTLVWRMIEQHWDLFLKRQFPAIARDLGIELHELEPAVERVKNLETRPGRKFGTERAHYVEPDVAVIKIGEDYIIQLNDDGLPRLRVSKAYRRMLQEMKSNGREAEAHQFLRDKMRSAVWLIKSLDQRQRTIYKVANSIVRQQRTFLDHGIEHLRPMVLRDVAEDIGMHESTVSRVVSNKYIHTPRGLFPMKFFFHSGIDRDYGEDISSLTVKRKIQQLIQSEDAKRPLSDSALARLLHKEGIQIARRTVAKYRDELGIPSSTDRRQIF